MVEARGQDAALPQVVFLRIWEPCNARCQMCSFWHSPDGPGLSFHAARRLFSDLADLGIREVVITGGEPFLYPGLDRLLGELAIGRETTEYAIITNGSRRDAVAAKILSNTIIKRVHVSLDALDDAGMEAIRGRSGWYSGVLEFVRLARRCNPSLLLVANVIINRYNHEHIVDYFGLDFDQINYLNLKGSGYDMALSCSDEKKVATRLTDFLISRPPDKGRNKIYVPLIGEGLSSLTSELSNHVWARETARRPCHITSQMAYVDHRGEMYPCNCLCHADRMESLGNVLDDGFAAVWFGRRAVQFRARCLESEWETCGDCDPANRLYNLAEQSDVRSPELDFSLHSDRKASSSIRLPVLGQR